MDGRARSHEAAEDGWIAQGRGGSRSEAERRGCLTRQHFLDECGSPIVHPHELSDARGDIKSKSRTVEDAVVADAGTSVMQLHGLGYAAAQVERSPALADTSDVVFLALVRNRG